MSCLPRQSCADSRNSGHAEPGTAAHGRLRSVGEGAGALAAAHIRLCRSTLRSELCTAGKARAREQGAPTFASCTTPGRAAGITDLSGLPQVRRRSSHRLTRSPMGLYSREKARRSLFNTIGYRAISQVATLLGYLVIVRSLSEQSFGVLSLLYAFIPVVSTLASLGLEQTLRRFQPEYLRFGNTAAAAWLVRFVSLARLISNAIIIAAILLAWKFVAPLFQLGPYREEFALFSVLVLLYFQARVLEFALASHMMHRYAVGSTVLLSVVKLAAYLILAALKLLTLRTAILVDTLAYVWAFLFLRFAYRRYPAAEAPPHYAPP